MLNSKLLEGERLFLLVQFCSCVDHVPNAAPRREVQRCRAARFFFFFSFAMATLQRLHPRLIKHPSSFNEFVRQLNRTLIFPRGCGGMFLPLRDSGKKREKDSYQFSTITTDSTGEEEGVEFLSQQVFAIYNGSFLRSSVLLFFSTSFLPLASQRFRCVRNQSPVESEDY